MYAVSAVLLNTDRLSLLSAESKKGLRCKTMLSSPQQPLTNHLGLYTRSWERFALPGRGVKDRSET